MRKVIFGILLSLFIVGNCYGHSFNGTYILDGFYSHKLDKVYGTSGWNKGNLVIDGNKFYLETRDNEPDSYGLHVKNGIIKESGKNVKVYNGSNYIFEIQKRGNSIKLIPKHNLEEVIKTWDGKKFITGEPLLSRQGEWISEVIPELKWKKVK